MLYAVGGADGTIRLSGWWCCGGDSRPYERSLEPRLKPWVWSPLRLPALYSNSPCQIFFCSLCFSSSLFWLWMFLSPNVVRAYRIRIHNFTRTQRHHISRAQRCFSWHLGCGESYGHMRKVHQWSISLLPWCGCILWWYGRNVPLSAWYLDSEPERRW